MPDQPIPHSYGDLDGEPIDLVVIRLSGAGGFGRTLEEGERIVLVVEGQAGLPTIKRVDGRLQRIHTIKVDKASEPTDRLADEAATFLQAYVDEIAGREALPFEDDTDEDDEDDEA